MTIHIDDSLTQKLLNVFNFFICYFLLGSIKKTKDNQPENMLKTSFKEGKKPIRLVKNLNWGLRIPFAVRWVTSRECHMEPAEFMLLHHRVFTRLEAHMKISFMLKWKWNVQLQTCSFFRQRSPRTQQMTLHGRVISKSCLGGRQLHAHTDAEGVTCWERHRCLLGAQGWWNIFICWPNEVVWQLFCFEPVLSLSERLAPSPGRMSSQKPYIKGHLVCLVNWPHVVVWLGE